MTRELDAKGLEAARKAAFAHAKSNGLSIAANGGVGDTIEAAIRAYLDSEALSKQGDGWIEWTGGENCPVPEGTLGWVILSGEDRSRPKGKPYSLSNWRWDRTFAGVGDIIAYQVVSP